MVELFAVGCEPIPEPVTARSQASPRCELPTLARLNEPDGTLTRIARCKPRYGPNPLDGICTHFDERDLAERMNASLDKACLRRPVNYAIGYNVKITPKTVSFRDYFHEPPPSRTSTSPCIRLYG